MGEHAPGAETDEPLSAKVEMLSRLGKIVEGLRGSGYGDDADTLQGVVTELQRTLRKDATIQDVIIRTLDAVVRNQITLDGRLVDALAFIAKQYGVVLAMHPVLLVIVAMGNSGNPDRSTLERSAYLDAVLATLVEDPAPYQSSLYALATMARNEGLNETADLAVDLLHEIRNKGADTMAKQALEIERAYERRPPTQGDELGWVVKILLTLASVAVVVESSRRIVAGFREFLDNIDGYLDQVGLGEPTPDELDEEVSAFEPAEPAEPADPSASEGQTP